MERTYSSLLLNTRVHCSQSVCTPVQCAGTPIRPMYLYTFTNVSRVDFGEIQWPTPNPKLVRHAVPLVQVLGFFFTYLVSYILKGSVVPSFIIPEVSQKAFDREKQPLLDKQDWSQMKHQISHEAITEGHWVVSIPLGNGFMRNLRL